MKDAEDGSVDKPGGHSSQPPDAQAPGCVPGNKPSIIIADDDPKSLEGLVRLLENRFSVVGRVGTGRALVEAVGRLSPAVVLTDITMPELNGIEAVRQIRATFPAVRAVILSIHDDPIFIEAAFEAGASAYVLKSDPPAEIISAIDDVLAGRTRRPDESQNP